MPRRTPEKFEPGMGEKSEEAESSERGGGIIGKDPDLIVLICQKNLV